MFDPTTRYQTRGIADELPIEIAVQIWRSIDMQLKLGKRLDYLQIFKMEKVGDCVLAIHHQQEVNEKTETISILYLEYRAEHEKILGETIYIIDDGDHSTILFAREY